MNVLTLLKNDHKAVGALLDEAMQCDPGDNRLDTLAKEIEKALTVHATIEEKFFYPALKDRSEDSEELVDVFEAYTEHALLKELIGLLKSGRQPDEQFKAELQVLAESVTHHVKEEESTIFGLAREMLDAEELNELGGEMEAEKKRLLSRSAGPSRQNGRVHKKTSKSKEKTTRQTARR